MRVQISRWSDVEMQFRELILLHLGRHSQVYVSYSPPSTTTTFYLQWAPSNFYIISSTIHTLCSHSYINILSNLGFNQATAIRSRLRDHGSCTQFWRCEKRVRYVLLVLCHNKYIFLRNVNTPLHCKKISLVFCHIRV